MSYQPHQSEDLTTKPVAMLPEWMKTPESHPDHHVVGHFYNDFWHGWIYYCDSYDRRTGYWMWPIMMDPGRKDATSEQVGTHRTNVSERAIDRTWHEVQEFKNPELMAELRQKLSVLQQAPEFINRHQVRGEQAWQLAKQ